ncbi:MAG: L,D-transpeptidase [Acidobacteriota bacterium]
MKLKCEKRCVKKSILISILTALTLFTFGCVPPETSNANVNVNVNSALVNSNTSTVAVEKNKESDMKMPVTLPVLDAMFADENFADDLKSKVQLSDEEIDKIKKTARDAVKNLSGDESENDSRSTRAATERAGTQIREIVGDEKAAKLFDFVQQRWSGGGDEANNSAVNNSSEVNGIPTDTRIVVNAPAYRMDLFQDGKLTKSYKIGIGYPEFPLPSGMRQAKTIIFNPTWTPPDEPWVKGKVEAGKTIEAGSKDNPLGPIKIPIGLPSLIHGGKSAAKLGGFASHGCVGLTNSQIQDFALNLAKMSGIDLTQKEILDYEKQKTETKNVSLEKSIPVELRYETIVVEDGKLNIYRDVYERGTNTEENLRKVLEKYGVSFDSLSEKDRDNILKGLKQMAYNAKGESVSEPNDNSNTGNSNMNSKSDNENAKNKDSKKDDGEVTRIIKGKKEVSFELAELKGKGYPKPVDMSQK